MSAGWLCAACRRTRWWCPPPAVRWSCGNAFYNSHHLYWVSESRTLKPCTGDQQIGVFPLCPGFTFDYRDVSSSLSLSGVCCKNATRMTAMHVCSPALRASNACTQSAAQMHAPSRKMADTLGENRKFRVFSLVCMQCQEYSRYGKPGGPNVRVSHALKVTLLSVTQMCVFWIYTQTLVYMSWVINSGPKKWILKELRVKFERFIHKNSIV